ncbi:hypothetical protein [Alkalihalobacillus sp. CinArs1]|uniref:hypothetical protein n=1 Tax=Alkalihalobacillus sp. CinArs1 TaxID=2995314 RepID=UPI0022DE1C2F|nr:hypothetical protein [Alkalihalobacillus sp. CinArs1]
MEQFYWKERAIGSLTKEEREHLNLLMPYFGLSIDARSSKASSAFTGKVVCIEGLPVELFDSLKKSLLHTGVRLTTNRHEAQDLRIFVEVRHSGSHPIALRVNNMNYYLKPLQLSTKNVQEHLHKHLWLPTLSATLRFRFQPYVSQQIPEWLSYAIIQSFYREELYPISAITFHEYQTIIKKVLRPINPHFANYQLNETETDWPDLPPELASSPTKKPIEAKKGLLEEKPKLSHQIEPFKNVNANQDVQTFNPFKFQNRENRRSIINPFQKKR